MASAGSFSSIHSHLNNKTKEFHKKLTIQTEQINVDNVNKSECNEICGGGAFESGYAVDGDEIDIAVRVAMVN